MNPDRQPVDLEVERVDWVPSSPEAIEVRVFGAWRGARVPPVPILAVDDQIFAALPEPPPAGRPPAWSAAFLVPVELRPEVEAGEASLALGGATVGLPAAAPGILEDEPEGTLVDPAVLAERRARRAEIAEQSAAQRAASAEQTVETLRAQLDQLEERVRRAGGDRDQLSARVADAERRLRLAEQREEAERRRRSELEEEVAEARRAAEAEVSELRDRLAGAEEITNALTRELESVRRRAEEAQRVATEERAARRRAEEAAARSAGDDADAADLRERVAHLDAARRQAEELAARRAAELAEAQRRAEDLARRADVGAEARAEAEALRAQAAALEARLADERLVRAELEALERQLAGERAAREEAERQLSRATAAAATGGGTSERERALAEQVEALELELARRTLAQERVQQAIALVRDELDHVREQVDEAQRARASSFAEVNELRAALERTTEDAALARSRADELAAALDRAHREAEADRAAVRAAEERLIAEQRERATLEAELEHLRALAPSAADDAVLRSQLEGRLEELREAVTDVRTRLRTATADLEARLAEERARREAAETRLAEALAERAGAEGRTEPPAPPTGAGELRPTGSAAASESSASSPAPAHPAAGLFARTEPPLESSGDPALDALIAGLREQVAAAREQLTEWGVEPAAAPPAAEAPDVSAETEPDAPQPRSMPAIDETRRRLLELQAEVRRATPNPEQGSAAHDVISDLQRAAERLRAAAGEDQEAAPAAPPSARSPFSPSRTPAPTPTSPTPPAPPRVESAPTDVPPHSRSAPSGAPPRVGNSATESSASGGRGAILPARHLEPRPEGPWLATALRTLATRDPSAAAELFTALLPAQGLAVPDDLAYDLVTPATGALRVRLDNGTGTVERLPAGPSRSEVDFVLNGDLATLVPLAAGGAPRRLKDAGVDGSRRRLRRLLRARKASVTLTDLLHSGAAPPPRLLLTALAGAVDPSWTAGRRFTVVYSLPPQGALSVLVEDRQPIAVTADRTTTASQPPLAAVVDVPADAFALLLAGRHAHATAEGDHDAVATLHGWFDRARGLVTG